ncbi:class I SAM-dependent methyltransferase [Leptolyngbya sp. 7M]|uniref:class I SAM-dependent methyltransferase n=1 Tax=Leptolyngbya sp. 7M TaxID=2812896 RepID=UPI001CEDA5DB|nr:class I SAM-dependent methyltransferase [Leptolyngbya sp. 7M]
MESNIDTKVVAGFGDEWTRFDQSELDELEHQRLFDVYFDKFPWGKLPEKAVGFDLGCGSGRWAKLVAPRVGKLHLIDPSDAIEVARKNLVGHSNCEFHRAGVGDIPLADESCDFGYSLGVLHHIPDTEAGLRKCVEKLKTGAPFLLYLYYAFDNRPAWFRAVWRISDVFRRAISRLPHGARFVASQIIAASVYFPLARLSLLAEKVGMKVSNIPLSQYREKSFYTMRTDALDRFGTSLEHRFTKAEIEGMMTSCGLKDIRFGDEPYWTALGIKE